MYLLVLLLPAVAYAAGGDISSASFVSSLIARFTAYVINPLLTILFAAAFIYFLWGAAMYIWGATEKTGKEEGKKHMLWGIIGMIIMVSAYSIINAAGSVIGIPAR